MSQNAIDIDIGGTFTDCYITHADRRVWCKARTTAYDLTVCMTEAIEDGAGRIGLTTEELLADTDIIRYSSTLAMNKLIERGGPPIALIMTHGFEDTIFIGRGSQWADGVPFKFVRNIAGVQRPEPLIDRSMVVGVHERIDSNGEIIFPLNEDLFIEHVAGNSLGSSCREKKIAIARSYSAVRVKAAAANCCRNCIEVVPLATICAKTSAY